MARTLRFTGVATLDGVLIPGSAIDTSYTIDEAVYYEVEIANAGIYTVSIAATLSIKALLIISDKIVAFYVPDDAVLLPCFGKHLLLLGDAAQSSLNDLKVENNSGVTATVKIFVWGT